MEKWLVGYLSFFPPLFLVCIGALCHSLSVSAVWLMLLLSTGYQPQRTSEIIRGGR